MATVDELFDQIESRAKAKEVPPFKVGDHVRRSEYGMLKRGRARAHTAVVKEIVRYYGGGPRNLWRVRVQLDGSKHDNWNLARSWELHTEYTMNVDDTCRELVDAYHRGDTDAALALADRIFELCGGSRTQTITTGDQ